MGKILKVILTIFASVILLVIIAAVALPIFIDPNDFKPEIQTAVKDNTGRELLIDGDLELSIFPWIGVSTGKLSLSNAPGFADKPFAEITESNIKVKLLPLFSKKLEVNRIVLKGLVLNLAKNKKGVSNWDDLSGSDKPAEKTEQDQPQETSASPLAAFAIGGISIMDSQIVWDDQQQGKYTEIKEFNLITDKLEFDEPVGIDLSLKIINKDPELTEEINFSTDLVLNEELNVFDLKKFNFHSVTIGQHIPGGKLTATLLAEIALNLADQTLNISGLKLDADDLALTAEISGNNIIDNPVFKGPINIKEFNLAQLMKNLAMPLPEMQDSNALSKLSVDFMLQATANSAEIQNLSIKLDDSNITGFTSIKNFSKPAINFNFDVDAIDVDRYMAPVKEGQASEKLATPSSAAAASASLFPVETLRSLNAKGQIKIGKLKIKKMNMQGLSLKLEAKNGVIKTQQAVNKLYQGAYKGNTSINVRNKRPVVALNEKLINVQIEPLLNDMIGEARITGQVNASVRAQGRGNTSAAIKSTLNGNMNFNFEGGVVKGFNLQKIFDNTKALIKGNPLPASSENDQTVFSVIKGTAQINNGLLSNNDLYAESSKLRVNGKGSAHLAKEKLDYQIHVKWLKQVATETEDELIKGMPFICNMVGTFSDPYCIPDIPAMLMQNKSKVIEKKKEEILKKLDEKLGPGVGDLIKGFF